MQNSDPRDGFFYLPLTPMTDPISGIIMEFFLFNRKNVSCMNSLEAPRRCDSNESTQHTITL